MAGCGLTRQIPRAARCLATAVSQSDPAGPSKARRFPKLDDGLTFGDFASGQELPTERVVLGNTSQQVQPIVASITC